MGGYGRRQQSLPGQGGRGPPRSVGEESGLLIVREATGKRGHNVFVEWDGGEDGADEEDDDGAGGDREGGADVTVHFDGTRDGEGRVL